MQKQPDGSVLIKWSAKVQVNNCDFEGDGLLKVSCPDKIHQVDQSIIAAAKENCEEWFGKKLSDEFLENVYDSALLSDNVLQASLVKNSQGQILTRFYDSKKNVVDPSDITGPYDVILEVYGISFIRRAYTPLWRILQVRERVKTDQYLFEDD